MQSILQSEKECYICANHLTAIDFMKCSRYANLESHHVFHGTANRKKAEEHGLMVWLCPEHHRGNSGVHRNRIVDEMLQQIAQREFERTHSRQVFMHEFGKNYL